MAEIYCNDLDCIYCQRLDDKHFVQRPPLFEPVGEEDVHAVGKCSLDEVHLEPRVIVEGKVKHRALKCFYRATNGISGHVDFSRIGKPQAVDEDGVREYNKTKDRKYY